MSSYYGSEPWNDGGSNLMFKMIGCLPQFGGTIGEDPVKHCQYFHHICGRMKPKDESLEEFKLKCFKFSLIDSAIVWYYSSDSEYADYYEDLRAKFLKKFSSPFLQLETRKEICTLKQSRDETLDEYYTYFDTIVSRCPHHGFTNEFLLQRFLGGMLPLDWKMLNDTVGGSLMKLTVTEVWDVIDDLAESTKRGPMHQTDEKDQALVVEVDSVQNEPGITPITSLPATNPEGDISTRAVMDVEAALEEPTWDLTPEPSEVMDESDTESTEEEPTWDLTAELTEKITAGPVLTKELFEKDLALVVEVPQLVPSVCMRITAPEDEVINDEVQGKLEAEQEQEKPSMERSLTTTQQGSPENSLMLKQPFTTATRKRLNMGTCLRSPMLDGTILNFQNCKGATHSNMKKRPRHGPKEWKPGRRNQRARLKGPAAMVKGPSPSQRYWKEKPPEQWNPDPNTSSHKNSGRIKARIKVGAAEKFDLSRTWDPDPS